MLKISKTGRKYWSNYVRKTVSKPRDPKYIKGTDEYKERNRLHQELHRKRLTSEGKAKDALAKRKASLKRIYGVTLEEYEQMVKDQNGRCAICNKLPTVGLWKRLVVDHNHNTNKIRKLLCDNCNRYLGFVKEDITLLENFIQYIKKYQ